ncbi:EpsG family protein [Enterobacter hormaechei]|uniref:EpsG family protein n=1 Tax=Enterobacter hormaechei TaxID=158836 RepID=UPI001981105A|nr:EpsG family protein [Enterobacter hormaechei]MBN4795481.1 EpsG family protein [Enterobacter hormaechei]MBN4819569.1 EpsG family protein [Enterobacter hormaechei]
MKKELKGLNIFLYCLLAVTLIYVATFRTIGVDADSLAYLEAYNAFRQGEITIAEPTFNLFSAISNNLIGAEGIVLVFFFYSFIAVTLKLYVIQRYSKEQFLSVIVYLCMFFILHELTQIRAGVAAAFFIFALPNLINGEKKKYILKILLACCFHLSAVLLLPLILISNKKINFSIVFLLPFICLASVLAIGDVSTLLIKIFSFFPGIIGDKVVAYINGAQLYGRFDNVNIFSKITLSTFAIFIIYFYGVLKSKSYDKYDIVFLKLFSIMLSVFYIFSSVPVLASRTFELLSASFILSFPIIISKFRPKFIPYFIIVAWLIIYLYVVNLKLIGL